MTPELALETRNQMLQDGYCIVDDILTVEFLQELRDETERLIAEHIEPKEMVYQGQHVNVHGAHNPHIQKLLEWQPSWDALEQLGFGDFSASGGVIILTKEAGGPPLYWHQDWMRWNDPLSCSPWPQTIFLNYYLTDTTRENGCLKVIPGTHLRRIDLHNQLVPAHEQGARFLPEDDPIMFSDHPDQVDIFAKAGSLVMADARLLHAAHNNTTDKRRTLILAWHSRPNTVPDYWDAEIPEPIANRDENGNYPGSRIPGDFLKA